MYYWSALLAFAAVGVSLVAPVVVGIVLTVGVGAAVLVATLGRLWRWVAARATWADGAAGGSPGASPGASPEGTGIVYPFTKSRPRTAKSASDQRKRSREEV